MSWIRRETEKGTVQYICPGCNDYHEFCEDLGERTFNENFIFCRRCGRRNGTGTAPTLTPQSEPLTCEGCIYEHNEHENCNYCKRASYLGDYYYCRPPEGKEAHP